MLGNYYENYIIDESETGEITFGGACDKNGNLLPDGEDEKYNITVFGIQLKDTVNKPQTKILVVDKVYLENLKSKEDLEEEYGCKVILIDSSKQNLQGLNRGNFPPIYYL